MVLIIVISKCVCYVSCALRFDLNGFECQFGCYSTHLPDKGRRQISCGLKSCIHCAGCILTRSSLYVLCCQIDKTNKYVNKLCPAVVGPTVRPDEVTGTFAPTSPQVNETFVSSEFPLNRGMCQLSEVSSQVLK